LEDQLRFRIQTPPSREPGPHQKDASPVLGLESIHRQRLALTPVRALHKSGFPRNTTGSLTVQLEISIKHTSSPDRGSRDLPTRSQTSPTGTVTQKTEGYWVRITNPTKYEKIESSLRIPRRARNPTGIAGSDSTQDLEHYNLTWYTNDR